MSDQPSNGDDKSSPSSPSVPASAREAEPAAAPASGGKQQPPSFEEIMQGLNAKKPEPKAAPKPGPKPEAKAAPKPAPKPPAQPSFEDIMAGALAPASGASRAASPPRPRREERKGGPRDENKGPVVVRKPSLKAGDRPERKPDTAAAAPEHAAPGSASAPAEGSGAAADGAHSTEHAAAPRASAPVPESVYAQPGSDEGADFGALFAQSQSAARPGKLKVGQKISARVAHLGSEVAFLDLGGKGEAIIDLRELRSDKGELLVHPGETIDGYVLSVGDGIVLTRSVPKGAGREVLHNAFESKLPVEGTVTGQNKGGLEVDLGGLRGFCPASQVDVRFVEDQSVFVGQKLKFRVTELRGGNAILSRRALLEEERAGQAQELRKRLEVGAQFEGTITGVRDFGAFVDLGGLEGLVHVSELSHTRVAHAQDVVKVGQKVSVQVLRIDKGEKGEERIALSLRALAEDPWDAARGELHEGRKMQGKVVRIQPFGAFVELVPGVDGLVHVSALSDKHVSHPREVVQTGEMIWVQIDSVDDAQKRVSLRRITEEEAQSEGPVPARTRGGKNESGAEGRGEGRGQSRGHEGAAAAPRARIGDIVQATVDRVEAYGVFVKWDAGKGLIPNAELGTERGTDNRKSHPVGTVVKAQILDIDERGRLRLSLTSAERAADRADYEQYQRNTKPPGKGLGTLGDLLRAKLQQRGE